MKELLRPLDRGGEFWNLEVAQGTEVRVKSCGCICSQLDDLFDQAVRGSCQAEMYPSIGERVYARHHAEAWAD